MLAGSERFERCVIMLVVVMVYTAENHMWLASTAGLGWDGGNDPEH